MLHAEAPIPDVRGCQAPVDGHDRARAEETIDRAQVAVDRPIVPGNGGSDTNVCGRYRAARRISTSVDDGSGGNTA